MRNMVSYQFVESAEQLIGEIKDHAMSKAMPFGFKIGIAIDTFKEIQDMLTEEILAAEAALNDFKDHVAEEIEHDLDSEN